MSKDERQQSGMISSRRNDQSKSNNQNDHELFPELIDPKRSPENHHLPSNSITDQSNKNHHHHPQIAATTASNAMSNTQTKLVANLHSAANDGKVELVRLLLRCGADVNAQDEQVS